MAVRLQPVYLRDPDAPSFVSQLAALRELTREKVTWLPPIRVSERAPDEAVAVVVPDLTGDAYRSLPAFAAIELPILIITSEFGTVSMWDWEIRRFLADRGVATIAPTSIQELDDVLGSLTTRATLTASTMLAYQDDLGAGMQPDIFKRFYWWEDECVRSLEDQFGVTVERRSFRGLAARAASLPVARVAEATRRTDRTVPIIGLTAEARDQAFRLYLALADEVDETPNVVAAGINCLNESATSPTTPCLAWNLLFEERGIIWGCEADLTSMITKVIVHKSLRVPVMMTNVYPFLLGQAALHHERIPHFPSVPAEPDNHLLVAHCGFFGVVPQSFATQWALRPRVLEIVDPRSNVIDARYPEGSTTIVKINSDLRGLTVTPAQLTGYEQYENSDCLNGAVLRVADGHHFVESTPSHHIILTPGEISRRLAVLAQVWGLTVSIAPPAPTTVPLPAYERL